MLNVYTSSTTKRQISPSIKDKESSLPSIPAKNMIFDN